MADKIGAQLFLTSAKENTGVEEAFRGLATAALKRYLASQPSTHGGGSGSSSSSASTAGIVKPGADEEQTGGKSGCAC